MGSCYLPGESDYYNTRPFGDLEPVSPLPQSSTQRGFYNEEFEPLKFESDSMLSSMLIFYYLYVFYSYRNLFICYEFIF